MAYTGHELKVARVTANLKATVVAEALGIKPYEMSRLERRAVVDLATAVRYHEALKHCADGIEEPGHGRAA